MAFELTGLWSVRTCYVAFYYESMSIEYRENLKAGTNPYSWPYWTRGCNLRGGVSRVCLRVPFTYTCVFYC